MVAQKWMVHAFPKGSIKPYPDTPEDYNKITLERLLDENNQLVDSWRFFLQPGSAVKYLNNERRIAKLGRAAHKPQIVDWMYAASVEFLRAAVYASPIVVGGVKAYQACIGSQ